MFASIVVLFVLLSDAIGNKEDVLQSKFDYQTQLLEKMIRMEYKMEQVEGRMNAMHGSVRSALELLTYTLDNKTTELEELEGRVAIPLVAFDAYSLQDTSPDTAQKIILQSVRLNSGDGYDTVLGIFTAPVPGLYQFAVHFCNYSGQAFQYYIMLDGTAIAESTKQNTAASDCDTCSVITQMTKGQRVWIQCASGSASNTQLTDSSYRKASFSGVLIHR